MSTSKNRRVTYCLTFWRISVANNAARLWLKEKENNNQTKKPSQFLPRLYFRLYWLLKITNRNSFCPEKRFGEVQRKPPTNG